MTSGILWIVENSSKYFACLDICYSCAKRDIESSAVTAGTEGPLYVLVGKKEFRHLRDKVRALYKTQVRDE